MGHQESWVGRSVRRVAPPDRGAGVVLEPGRVPGSWRVRWPDGRTSVELQKGLAVVPPDPPAILT